jgi:hypothetical protein
LCVCGWSSLVRLICSRGEAAPPLDGRVRRRGHVRATRVRAVRGDRSGRDEGASALKQRCVMRANRMRLEYIAFWFIIQCELASATMRTARLSLSHDATVAVLFDFHLVGCFACLGAHHPSRVSCAPLRVPLAQLESARCFADGQQLGCKLNGACARVARRSHAEDVRAGGEENGVCRKKESACERNGNIARTGPIIGRPPEHA